MNKKIISTILTLLALLFPATNFLSAQVAAPPTGPLLIEVSPSSGEQGQTLGLALYGENFQNGAQVSFNPSDGIVINLTIVTVEKITLQISIASDAPTSLRDVIVTNPNQITATYNDGFLVKVPSDTTPPPPILGLTATDALDGKIDLTWTKSEAADFDHYAIYWDEIIFENLTGRTPNATIFDQTTTTFQATGLTNGTKYYFAVTALDNAGNEDKNVLPANATPTQSTVPSVTIPFPTEPATNRAPALTAPVTAEKKVGEVFPVGLTTGISILFLAALGGLIYSILKKRIKKSSKEMDIDKEIEKEEELRFLNENSKLTKLEIVLGGGKIVDLVREIINFSPEYKDTGIPINLAMQIFDTQKENLQKIIGGKIPATESDALEYTISISPVSGVDLEWQIAEVSLGGVRPTGKYEVKKQGNDFTYEKKVKVAKTDAAWKNYADPAAPDFVDLKKIIKFHLDDLGRQEERARHLNGSFCSVKSC